MEKKAENHLYLIRSDKKNKHILITFEFRGVLGNKSKSETVSERLEQDSTPVKQSFQLKTEAFCKSQTSMSNFMQKKVS